MKCLVGCAAIIVWFFATSKAEWEDDDLSRSLIITYSDECDKNVSSDQIVANLLSTHDSTKEFSRRLSENDESSRLHISEAVVNSRERIRRARESQHGMRRVLVSTDEPNQASSHAERPIQSSADLSQMGIDERRDFLLASLEVSINMMIINHTTSEGPHHVVLSSSDDSFDRSSSLYNSHAPVQFVPHYLNKIKIDIMTNPFETDQEKSRLLFSTAAHLPCLEGHPELDANRYPATDDYKIPNDLQDDQWNFKNAALNQKYGANLVDAWDTFSGSSAPSFIVGIVDEAFTMHPDLEPNICLPGDAECGSYDFGDDDFNPFDDPRPLSHGTAVASVIAALPANHFGLAGGCWACRLSCLKTYSSKYKAITLMALLRAYNYLLEKKIRISNHSYITYSRSVAEYIAINRLTFAGHLVVAAAGNDNCNLDETAAEYIMSRPKNRSFCGMASPAGIPRKHVMAVGGISPGGGKYSSGNWGPVTVDLLAPAVNILVLRSTSKSGKMYDTVSGTSFAAPLVTAAAALVWGRNENQTAIEVRNHIVAAARKYPQVKGLSSSGGILDVAAAVNRVTNGRVDRGWSHKNAPLHDRTAFFRGDAFLGWQTLNLFVLIFFM